MKITKKCPRCKVTLNISEYSNNACNKDGLHSYCKKCNHLHVKKYGRTKEGVVTRIYGDQKSHSKDRQHPLPTYTQKELREWLYSQKKFHELYDNWVRLDFQKDYKPSVDRKDDYISYTMDNIQLMTWRENRKKHDKDRRNGKTNKANKSIVQYSRDMDFIDEYYSISLASRKTGINLGNIGSCCTGDRKTAGGFKWRYAK